MNQLGKNIRTVRKQNNLTLKELSEKTGFSISFLSQLERGKSSATLESLKKISLALNINPSYFFDDNTNSNEIEENQINIRKTNQNILYVDLNKHVANPAFSPLLVTLQPTESSSGNLFSHDGQEFLYILEGELTVQIGNQKHVLKKDESIMFDSNIQHNWYNTTNEQVKFLCIAYDRK